MRAIFINLHELAERHWKHGLTGGGKWVVAKLVLQARNKYRKSKRVEAGFCKVEVILKRCQDLAMLARNLRHLVHYGYFYRHITRPSCMTYVSTTITTRSR